MAFILVCQQGATAILGIIWVVPLPRMPVTTRIMRVLESGIPINLHLPLLLGRGPTQGIIKVIFKREVETDLALLQTNISLKSAGTFESMIFLFPRWDMLVSWRLLSGCLDLRFHIMKIYTVVKVDGATPKKTGLLRGHDKHF